MVNKALQHYDTVYVVPLFRIGDLVHNIISGAVFLQEFGDYKTYEFTFFMLGIAICVLAVLMLLFDNDKNEKSKTSSKMSHLKELDKMSNEI